MLLTSYDSLKAYRDAYRLLPVCAAFYADSLTPVQALRRLKELSTQVFLLESAENSGRRGRYSFLGFNPKMEISCRDGLFTKSENGEVSVFKTQDPTAQIEALMRDYTSPVIRTLPPFTGGLIGYVAYDYYKYQEPVLHFTNPDPYGFDDMRLMLFDELIVFDHFTDKLMIIVNARADAFETEFERALSRIEVIKDCLDTPASKRYPGKITRAFEPVFSKEDYAEKIEKAREYIIAGDIFQVVPSNRIKGEVDGSLFAAYRVMRSDNPSPYMYYLQSGESEIIGASPETLVRLEGSALSTFPIAGSRPRGKDADEDFRLEQDLLTDAKELAEHNMLVDLGRNDLGRVCRRGSVQVEDYLNVQRYSKIMHLTSRVSGEIKDGLSAVQALASTLPAGTLSGAPKIRACEIIEELEEERRGVYGGAVGYLAFNGNMDMCIAIRSAYKMHDAVYVQSGGGIVYDSRPDPEYTETVNKAAAVVEAIEKGQAL